MPHDLPLIGSEMLATAEALRLMTGRVADLIDTHEAGLHQLPEAAIVLIDGLNVADALERIGRRLVGSN